MENSQKINKAQVALEFCLAFIIILLFFLGSLNIWLRLNSQSVTECRQYQLQRFDAGNGNFVIPDDPEYGG